FKFPSGGVLSVDGIGSFAKDAVNLATAGSLTQCSTLTKDPFSGQTECTNSIPGYLHRFVQPVGLRGDAVEQRRLYAEHQVQVAGLDVLRLLPIYPPAESERLLHEWLRDHRLFQRAGNDPRL